MTNEPLIYAIDDDPQFLIALECVLITNSLPVRSYTSAAPFLADVDAEQPGCVISDMRMPDCDGLQLQKSLRLRQCQLPIIFMTGYSDTRRAVAALKGGAVDFLEKPFSEQQLLESVATALQKDASDRRLAREKHVVQERYANLTPREQQVFELVVSDLPNKLVAQKLNISPRTVERHREHMMRKMQAKSLTELITMAVLCGLRELHLHAPSPFDYEYTFDNAHFPVRSSTQ